MKFTELVGRVRTATAVGYRALAGLGDAMVIQHAKIRVEHRRPFDFDERRGIWLYRDVDPPERRCDVSFVQNTTVRITASFRTVGGDPYSPGAGNAQLYVIRPSGEREQREVQEASTGNYYAAFLAADVGLHRYRWEAQLPDGLALAEGQFDVVASAFVA